ncbi:fimbrial biogenesis chaperone [Morganella morganii]|uniref:fimbrial biogenesis chaperone n=1 Tax=Morganella morganii TaxID=582 RepID=UPI0004693DD5|nr:molecular chaperone [Morganella morganii]
MFGFQTFLFSIRALGLALLMMGISSSVLAEGLSLPQTRVIFPEKQKSVIAGIDNKGDNTYLIKAQVITSLTEKNNTLMVSTPFVVTPPLFRLEPQARYSVRIFTQSTTSLPTDRESVFYLSFLAIPATKPTDKNSTQVSIGLNTVIKLFYRPSGLISAAEAAQERLTFYAQSGQTVVHNPTPYYITLSSLQRDGRELDVALAGPMLAPYSQVTLKGVSPGREMRYSVINDLGGDSQVYLTTVQLAPPHLKELHQ